VFAGDAPLVYLVTNSRKESALYMGPIGRYYKVWNPVDGKEFFECLNNNSGCFIAKFLNFKPPEVIVYDNEVDFPYQLEQIGCNSFPWTKWNRG